MNPFLSGFEGSVCGEERERRGWEFLCTKCVLCVRAGWFLQGESLEVCTSVEWMWGNKEMLLAPQFHLYKWQMGTCVLIR